MVKLTKPFIPAADEVGKLESGKDPASRLFQRIATRHLRGLRTTQGTYILTPSGFLISSGHSIKEEQLGAFLKKGLAEYQKFSKSLTPSIAKPCPRYFETRTAPLARGSTSPPS